MSSCTLNQCQKVLQASVCIFCAKGCLCGPGSNEKFPKSVVKIKKTNPYSKYKIIISKNSRYQESTFYLQKTIKSY